MTHAMKLRFPTLNQ
ncbi:erythromycin resistance leader peptide [Bacillus cereus]|uniref:Uncharacterized protein n=1 Tax=Lentibacillus salicampi TaxID=175306 RepID=A0A4Y9A705_9BACI|nr:hypothetical protein E4U82_17635 [Lentibacillus salicampi]HEK9098937.1 erythromycin resistance leader peptide [Bacillus pseudomycoides]HEK9104165.1 erythromycin resistance leader peptide [Bacillus pseudomycoides]